MTVLRLQAGVGRGEEPADHAECPEQEAPEGDRGQDSAHAGLVRGKYPRGRERHQRPGQLEDSFERHPEKAKGWKALKLLITGCKCFFLGLKLLRSVFLSDSY